MKATGPLQIDANREDSIDALTLEPIRNPFLFAGKLYERSTLAKLLGRTRLVGELGKRVEYNPKMRSSPSLSLPTTTTTTRVVSPPDSPQTRSMEPPPSRHNHVQSYNGLEALLKAVEHDQLKQGMPTVELGPQKGTPTIR